MTNVSIARGKAENNRRRGRRAQPEEQGQPWEIHNVIFAAMLSRPWCLVVAFGWLILGSSLAYAQESEWVCKVSPAEEENQGPKADCRASNGERSALPVVIVETPEQAAGASERERKSDEHEAADLQAQRDAAAGAQRAAATAERQEYPTLILASAGAFIAAAAFVYTILSNQRANKTAQDQVRAYISVSAVTMTERPSATPNLFVHCDNTGQTPATFVAVAAKVARLKEDDLPVAGVRDAYAYDAIGPVGAQRIGEYHFRGTEFGDELGAAIRSSDRSKVFVIYGVVRYGTIFGEIYESDFMFFLPANREGNSGKFRRAPNMLLRTYRRLKKGE